MKNLIVKILRENRNFYDYQFGFCHYFAMNVKEKLQKLLPNKDITYYLYIIKMEQLDIVKLIENNPITKLSNDYNVNLLTKIKSNFTDFEQQLFFPVNLLICLR